MVYTKQFHFQEPIHPKETLSRLLNSRKISQKELAVRTGVSDKHISSIMTGKSNITPEFAAKLEKALGLPAAFWNNLQKSYDEDRVTLELEKQLDAEKEYARNFPYKELSDWGFVPQTQKINERVSNLQSFFGVSSLNNVENLMALAFKKDKKSELSESNFKAWIRTGELIADNIILKQSYSEGKLRNLLPQLKSMTLDYTIDIKKISELMATVGIRFVMVPSITKVNVVGISRKYKSAPLIQLSDRDKKNDIFWFAFFHEIAHIILHPTNEGEIFINYDKKELADKKEQEANEFAESTLLGGVSEQELIRGIDDGIENFSYNQGVGSPIIAGILCHKLQTKKPKIWREMSKHRIKLELKNTQLPNKSQ